MKIYEIVWFDAQTSTQTLSIHELKDMFKPHLTKSVGYLVEDAKEYVILAFTSFGDGQFKHWQVIPKGMIKTQKVLKK